MLTNERIHKLAGPADYYDRLVFASAIESAATAPLLARIAELEELNRLNNQIINTQHAAMVNAEQRGIAKGLEECAERIAALTAQVEQRHVGDSGFESWYGQHLLTAPVHRGAKQLARDAYAAGMGERQATAPPKEVPLTDEQIESAAKVLSHCMDYPWGHMPEAGRLNMRKNAKTVIEAAIGTPATVEKGETP